VSRSNLFTYAFLFLSLISFCQVSNQPDPESEKKFSGYMYSNHGGVKGLEDFKRNHLNEYIKELQYYSESFYVKRNHLGEGVTLDESIIDITRFENQRKPNEEAIVILPGFKDAIVLLPDTKLIYKPEKK
jgi:hypothetical protein